MLGGRVTKTSARKFKFEQVTGEVVAGKTKEQGIMAAETSKQSYPWVTNENELIVPGLRHPAVTEQQVIEALNPELQVIDIS